jgi:hypothetical protein
MRPRVSIITTIGHNVGDDFVREGIIHLLQKAIGPFELSLINKHLPITARHELAWIHSTGISRFLDRLGDDFALRSTSKLDKYLPVVASTDKVRRADILVQSGAPVYWMDPRGDCAHTEWWGPLIERRWLPVSKGRAFLNLAGGTCQRYGSDGSEFSGNGAVLEHIRRFYDLTALTTVRDELSLRVLEQACRPGYLLPCTSIFAVDRLGVRPQAGEFVALNYMPTGGHYILDQAIDTETWERRFVSLARRLARDERVVLVCHNRKELAAAIRLVPDLDRFYSARYEDYLKLYSRTKWGLVNRVHGAFAMASLGKPAAVIGSDTRAHMARVLGLPEVFVNDATESWIDSTIPWLRAAASDFPQRIAEIKATAAVGYDEKLRAALRGIAANDNLSTCPLVYQER